MTLPFSQACENNKLPILECIRRHLIDYDHVFEIGSGTGQHAEFFTQQLPHVTWQASDRQENLDGLNQRLHLCDSDRLPSAIEFDVELSIWPSGLRCVYSANTAHIMPWPITQKMVIGVAQNLLDNGLFILYGPFRAPLKIVFSGLQISSKFFEVARNANTNQLMWITIKSNAHCGRIVHFSQRFLSIFKFLTYSSCEGSLIGACCTQGSSFQP